MNGMVILIQLLHALKTTDTIPVDNSDRGRLHLLYYKSMSNTRRKVLFCLFSLLLLFEVGLRAQDSLYKVRMPVFVRSSFYYDFPQSFGASAGVDFPARAKEIVTMDKNGETSLKYRDLIVAGDIGFYRYPYNNSGLYFFQSIGKRYHKNKPYYYEWLARIGLLRSFYDAIVYTVDANDNVRVLNNFGRYYLATGFLAVFGYDFERSKKPLPLAIDFRSYLWIQYPYNSFVLPHLSFELSFKYHIDKFNIAIKKNQVEENIRK